MMRYNNRKGKKKGAALVEFAIMTTIMIPLLLYINFFTELLSLRLKVDEMGYFAAWEMAAYRLTDYRGTPNSDASGAFTNASNEIKTTVNDLYGGLDSADPNRSISFLMISPTLTGNKLKIDTTLTASSNIIEADQGDVGGDAGMDSSGSSGDAVTQILGQINNFLSKGINFVLGGAFGFNTDNMGVTSTVSVGFTITERMKITDTNKFSDKKLLQDELLDNTATITSKPFTVWVDTWALDDGRDAINVSTRRECLKGFLSNSLGCSDIPYARQVQRMSLLGTWIGGTIVRNLVKVAGSGGLSYLKNVPLIGKLFKNWDSPVEARMVSINYKHDYNKNESTKRGVFTADVAKGQRNFQTTPIVNIFRRYGDDAQTHEGIKEYFETLKARRNFYMGNDKPNCTFTGIQQTCQ